MADEEVKYSYLTNTFLIITLIFFIFNLVTARINTSAKYSEFVEKAGGIRFSTSIIYAFIVVLFQIVNNVKNARILCGRGTAQKAILHTITPNILIFILVVILLQAMPSWKAPFSNTFGYLIALSPLGSVKSTFSKLIRENSNDKLISLVYQDKSLMINEMTPENFVLFFEKMTKQGIIKGPNDTFPDETRNELMIKLYNGVLIKDIVSKTLWYMMAGLVSISIAYNNVLTMTINCKKSESDIKKEMNERGLNEE